MRCTNLLPLVFMSLQANDSLNTLDTDPMTEGQRTRSVLFWVPHPFSENQVTESVREWRWGFERRVEGERLATECKLIGGIRFD